MNAEQQAAQMAQLKQQLADIHWPEPVSAWPPAIGWILLSSAALLLLCVVLYLAYRHYRANTYRREALAELSALDPTHPQRTATALSQLLRRCQLHLAPEADHSSQGDARQRQLAAFCRRECPLSATDIRTIETLAFGAQTLEPEAMTELMEHSRKWIVSHRHKPAHREAKHA